MNLVQKLTEGSKVGFWLPMYPGDEDSERAVKRIVLRSFRHYIQDQRQFHGIVFVKDFQFIEHVPACACEAMYGYYKSYGWKASVKSVDIIP